MNIIKQVLLSVAVVALGLVILAGYAYAEGEYNNASALSAASKDASGNPLICVKCYKSFSDYSDEIPYKVIFVSAGTTGIDEYLNVPEREGYIFAKWEFYDTVKGEEVNVIDNNNIIVYGNWYLNPKPVSADADTSSEDSLYAKLTCYLDMEAYNSGDSYGSINIMKGYNGVKALDIPRRDNYIFEGWQFVDKDGKPSDYVMTENKSVYGRWKGPVPSSGVSEDASEPASYDASGNPMVRVTYYKSFEDYRSNTVYKELYANRYTDTGALVETPARESYKFICWRYVENGEAVDMPEFKKHVYCYGDWQGPFSDTDIQLPDYISLRDSAKITVKNLKRKKKQLKINVCCQGFLNSGEGINCEVCYWIKGKPKTKKTVTFAKNKGVNTAYTLKKLKSGKKYSVKARVKAVYKDVEYVSKWSKTAKYKTK